MQITTYISQITGKSFVELFDIQSPLVRLEQHTGKPIAISHWDSSLDVPQPSDEDLEAALSADEPIAVPTSVSARQFKLQLLAERLLDQVDAWVAVQPKAVQIAYEYSGQFLRSEPMMATGFASLNFTDAQIDAFYVAAAKL